MQEATSFLASNTAVDTSSALLLQLLSGASPFSAVATEQPGPLQPPAKGKVLNESSSIDSTRMRMSTVREPLFAQLVNR